MAKVVKCVLMFRDSTGTGWSEVHYWNSPSDNPLLDTRISNLVNVIAPTRALLLGADTFVIGARASFDRPEAVASLNKDFYYQGDLNQSTTSASVSLTLSWTDGSRTRKKKTYLRGIWDSAEINGEYHPENPPAAGFDERLNEYKTKLIEGQYGWLTKSTTNSRKGIVTGYSSSADGLVTFLLAAPGLTGVTVGGREEIAFARINNSNSVLNQTLLVQVNSATSVTTVSPIAAGPFIAQGTYNYRATEFVGYSQLYNVKIGRRQQGRPIGLLPGRRKARARY